MDEDLQRLVPDKYDIIKIVLFLGVLLVAFFVGYTLKEVYVCKKWFNDQLVYFPATDGPIVYDWYLNNTLNKFNVS